MEKISGNHASVKSVNNVTEEDIRLINQYTQRPFDRNELYIFRVVLCDNDIDRDNEYFSVEALTKMSQLFVGKTGITDHNPSADRQTARIFQCTLEKTDNRRTAYGEPYYRLVGRAYIPVNEHTQPVIDMIESGIRKEISVGCSVDDVRCNICHTDIRKSPCEHQKGHLYNGRQCCHILQNVSDAYEWSFVAVPSQRMAGVIKNFQNTDSEVNVEDFIQDLKKGKCQSLDGKTVNVLLDYISELEKYARFGKVYYENLKKEYVRYNTLLFDGSEETFFSDVATRYTVEELETLVKMSKKRVENADCSRPQLFSDDCFDGNDSDSRYSI